VAWEDFEHPWKTVAPPSQNAIRCYLIAWLRSATLPCLPLILVFDRGYTRVEWLKAG